MMMRFSLDGGVEDIDDSNPAVPYDLMVEGWVLYLGVSARKVKFTRTPEDMYSPLMGELRPILQLVPAASVDAALAVQRFLMLRGPDALPYCNSMLNRIAIIMLGREIPVLRKFYRVDRFRSLITALAAIPLSELVNRSSKSLRWDVLDAAALGTESGGPTPRKPWNSLSPEFQQLFSGLPDDPDLLPGGDGAPSRELH